MGPDRSLQHPQVDVAILSEDRQQIEGYTCKINPKAIASADCTNLTALAVHAQRCSYEAHMGVICFDNSKLIRQRLELFQQTTSIYAYGIDNLQKLQTSPFGNT